MGYNYMFKGNEIFNKWRLRLHTRVFISYLCDNDTILGCNDSGAILSAGTLDVNADL